jgi:acylphosphatase
MLLGLSTLPTLEITITGRVQGVGFRSYVSYRARLLGILGETWNARDGSVRVIAQHKSDGVLAAFTSQMHEGPGRVDGVTAVPLVSHDYLDFEVTGSR